MIKTVIDEVCDFFNIDDITSAKRLPRLLVLYICVEVYGLDRREVAQAVGHSITYNYPIVLQYAGEINLTDQGYYKTIIKNIDIAKAKKPNINILRLNKEETALYETIVFVASTSLENVYYAFMSSGKEYVIRSGKCRDNPYLDRLFEYYIKQN